MREVRSGARWGARWCGRAVAAAVGSLALVADGGAAAQEPDTLVLSLGEAISVAEDHNPTYRRAVNDLGLNGLESRTTWAKQVLPSASLTLFNTGYTGNLQRRARDNFGNPIERPETDWVYFSDTRQSLNLNWRLQGASIVQALDRQDHTNAGRVLAEERSRTDVRGDVRRRFWTVLRERELLAVEEELAEAGEVDQDIAERLFRLALRSRVDVLNAELAIEQQALAVERQRAAFEQARLSLRTTLGDPDLPPLRLEDEPIPLFDPRGLDGDVLVDRALEVNPEVRSAAAALTGADLGVSESRVRWWPSLDLGFNVYRRSQEPETSALFDVSFDEDLESNFYLQLSMPFFDDWFGNRLSIERSEVERQNAREALREARLVAEEAVRRALLDLRNRHETLRLAERSREIAEEALRLAREEYRLGTRSFEELRDAVQQAADTRRQVIEARYGFADALVTLEEAVGAPVRGPAPVTEDEGGATT